MSLPAVIPPASAVADVLALAGGPGLGRLRELLSGDVAGCVVVVAGAVVDDLSVPDNSVPDNSVPDNKGKQ